METHDEQTISSYTMLNTPTAAYKSTATMASVKDYLAQSMVVLPEALAVSEKIAAIPSPD